jgi:peroxiredoxin
VNAALGSVKRAQERATQTLITKLETGLNDRLDALMQTRPDFANRLSYVIAPNGKVAYYYQNLNPDKHVERMLNAVRALPRPGAPR